MRKLFSALMAAVMLAGVMTGCSSNPGTTSNPSAPSSSSGKTDAPASSSAAPGGWSKTITLADGSTYPSGTVTLIAPFAAGGSVDLGDRLFVEHAAKYTDATIIVENVTGGSGLTGTQQGLNAAPDGYTMWHIAADGQYVTTANSVCPFDTLTEMSFIGGFVQDDRVWVARVGEDRFTNAQEWLDYCKAHPGDVTVAASGSGTIASIGSYYLADEMGIELNVIGYGGSAEAKAAFLGGECDIMGCSVSEAAAMLGDNQCTVLMSLTEERIYDDVPTVAELGYPDAVCLTTLRGLAMSSKVDPAIVAYWEQVLDMVANDPEFQAAAQAMTLVIHHRDSADFRGCFEEFFPIFHDIKEDLGL